MHTTIMVLDDYTVVQCHYRPSFDPCRECGKQRQYNNLWPLRTIHCRNEIVLARSYSTLISLQTFNSAFRRLSLNVISDEKEAKASVIRITVPQSSVLANIPFICSLMSLRTLLFRSFLSWPTYGLEHTVTTGIDFSLDESWTTSKCILGFYWHFVGISFSTCSPVQQGACGPCRRLFPCLIPCGFVSLFRPWRQQRVIKCSECGQGCLRYRQLARSHTNVRHIRRYFRLLNDELCNPQRILEANQQYFPFPFPCLRQAFLFVQAYYLSLDFVLLSPGTCVNIFFTFGAPELRSTEAVLGMAYSSIVTVVAITLTTPNRPVLANSSFLDD